MRPAISTFSETSLGCLAPGIVAATAGCRRPNCKAAALRGILKSSQIQEEKEGLVRRFVTQVKQAVQDFETKYEKRIRNLKVVSNLPNVEQYIGKFRNNLQNTGFKLFDPVQALKVPQQLERSVGMINRSYLATAVSYTHLTLPTNREV